MRYRTAELKGGAGRAVLLLFNITLMLGLGWQSAVLAQTPTQTWKPLDALSPAERAELELRPETPRDPQIPYLPAEPYPFSPPYTAEELGYLAFELDTLRPRFSHIWLSVVQSMTAGGYILATLKNNTAILYGSSGSSVGDFGAF